VTVSFEDGSKATGRLIIGCDGAQSRIRRALFPDRSANHVLPICFLGVRMDLAPDEIKPMRQLDPLFLAGTASGNDAFVFFSSQSFPLANLPS
jgi:2-polyprenyl-6-methoxyphenol hydroxylase-like FAD-dependent oxidoreductase